MTHSFSRYAVFTQAKMKALLSYRSSFALAIVANGLSLLANMYLWRAVYGKSTTLVLSSYDLPQITNYVIASSLLYITIDSGIEHEISADIMRGDIAFGLIRPVNYILLNFFSSLSKVLFNFFLTALPVCTAGIFLFGLRPPSSGDLALFGVSAGLSIVINFLINIIVGFLALVTTNNWGLHVMKTAIVGILSGHLIPLSFFGEAAQKVVRILPFASLINAPVTLLLGRYSGTGAALAILAGQISWAVLLALLARVLWTRLATRLEVAGG